MKSNSYRIGTPANSWEIKGDVIDITRPPLVSRSMSLKTESKTLEIDMSKTALLVIDMQNDFCHVDGWVGHAGYDVSVVRTPIAPLQKLIPAVRGVDIPIIWVDWQNSASLFEVSASRQYVYNPTGDGFNLGETLPGNKDTVLTKGSWGSQVIDELEQKPEDICVDKFDMNGFWNTPLDNILRNLGKETLIFTGVNTDQCVMTTLQNASFLGYDCILLRDCTATLSPEYCSQATFYNVEACFGFVTNSEAVLEGIS